MDTEDDLEIYVLKSLSAQRRCGLSLLTLFQSLKKMKCRSLDDATQLKMKLERIPSVVVTSEGESLLSTSARIEISIAVCKEYAMNRGTCASGENCTDLHICKHFLISDFCRRNGCIFGHNLNTPHNQQILQSYGLDKLSLENVRNIFRCPWNRCAVTTPELCHKFQQKTCKASSTKCFRMHLCPDYISGSCSRGANCEGHNVLEKSTTKILEKYGFDTQQSEKELLSDLRELDLSPLPLSRSISESHIASPVRRGGRSNRSDFKSGIQRDNGQGKQRGGGGRGVRGVRGGRGGRGGFRGRGDNREEPSQFQNRPQPLIDLAVRPPLPHSNSYSDVNSYNTQGPMIGQASFPRPPAWPYQQSWNQQAHSQAAAPYYQQPQNYQPPGAQGVPPFPVNHGLGAPYHQPPRQWTSQQPGPSYQQFHESQYPQQLDRERYLPQTGTGPSYQQDQESQYPQQLGREEPKPKKQTKQDQKGTVEKNTDEICMYKFRKCQRFDKCPKHHRPMIYQWQHAEIGSQGQQTWEDFDKDTNTELEKTYADPGEESCPVAFRKGNLVRISFEDMTGLSRQTKISVRRLSTPSSNSPSMQPTLFKWATQWRWYWEDDSGTWVEYGKTGTGGYTTEINSDSIESAYQKDTRGTLDYRMAGFNYTLMFDKMMQTNLSTSKGRRLRRRPQFVTKEELGKRPNFDPRRKKQLCPKGWSIGQTNAEKLFKHYARMMVNKNTDEFQKIVNLFHQTLPNNNIVSLERIENGELWMDFDGQKEKMEMRTGKPAAERQLFHGTTEETVEAISKEGFDFRFSATRVGAIHGAGSYFAKEARYSDCYAEPSAGVKRMFVARVLVGEFTKGERNFRRPPPKSADNPHELFDSCVDDVNDPKIFVIFTLDQVYPQYIITYN